MVHRTAQLNVVNVRKNEKTVAAAGSKDYADIEIAGFREAKNARNVSVRIKKPEDRRRRSDVAKQEAKKPLCLNNKPED